MRADRQNPHIAELRRLKPVSFVIKLRDGTQRDVPLSTKQNKWELLLRIIDKLPWTSIEALDNDGKLLGVVEQDDDSEDEGEYVDEEIIRAKAIAVIIKDAVQFAMVETRKNFELQIRGYDQMATRMLDSQQVMADSYRTAMQVQQLNANVPPEEQDKVMQMLQIAFAMMTSGKPPTINVTPPAPTPKAVAAPPRPANGVATKG